MGWPEDRLNIEVEMSPTAGQWVNLTSAGDVYGHDRAAIEVSRGRSNLASRLESGRCSLELNNRGGRYSPRNPRSPYYGQIGRNTPIRVSVPGPTALLVQSTTSGEVGILTPSTTALDITGDLDVRFDAALSNWEVPGSVQLCGKGHFADNRAWALMARDSNAHFEWSVTGTSTIEADSTVPLPVPPSGHLAVRATLDVDNGAGGWTVTFYTAPSIAGPWQQLGDPITGDGVTSIHSNTVAVRVGDGLDSLSFPGAYGRVYAFQLLDGIDGALVADVDMSAQTPGVDPFEDAAGNVWTLSPNTRVSDRYYRFVGEVSEWPQQWQAGGADAWTPIEGAGVLRRYRQGTKALRSTLRRRIPSGGPLAYWPMEEGSDATQAYSPTPGVRALNTRGLGWASDSALPGSDALPTLAEDAHIDGRVPLGAGGQWHVELVYNLDQMPDTLTDMLEIVTVGSPTQKHQVTVQTNNVRVEGLAPDGTRTYLINSTAPEFTGAWSRLQIFAQPDGADTSLTMRYIPIGGTGHQLSTTFNGDAGKVAGLNSDFGAGLRGMGIGHLAVFDEPDTLIYNNADTGFAGETAVTRLQRLAQEEDLLLSVKDAPGDSEQLGPQQIAALLDNVQDAAEADGGLLLEQRETAGFQYRQRATLYNQPPSLTLDYRVTGEVEQPFDPVDDDTALANDVTVSRRNGSSARATLTDGPLSVQAPPDGVGVYDDTVTLNLANDQQAPQIAGWLLHLGTVDEARYPRLTINLRSAPQLIDQVLSLDVGDIIQVDNLPDFLPPGPILLRVEGYTETLNAFDWRITFNCSPASPWTIAVLGDDQLGRADTDGSMLASTIAQDDTVLPIRVTDGPLWTTDPDEAPFNIRAGGETMTVTSVAPVTIDTFDRAVTGGWGAAPSGTTWTCTGGTPSDYSVTAGAGHMACNSLTEYRYCTLPYEWPDVDYTVSMTMPVVPTGDQIYTYIMFRYASEDAWYFARLYFYTDGTAELSLRKRNPTETILATAPRRLTHTSGQTYRVRVAARGDQLTAKAWHADGQEPEGWQVAAHDTDITGPGAIGVRTYLGGALTNPLPLDVTFDDLDDNTRQTFTVTRAINGIHKTQSAGTDVRLAQPAITAL